MKKKVMAIAAGVCTLGMLLSGCGGSGSTASAGNVITAFNSEPQNALIPGDTNAVSYTHLRAHETSV